MYTTEMNLIKKKAHISFRDTYEAIASDDVTKAMMCLGGFVAYMDLLGLNLKEDSRYYILINLIQDKFGIEINENKSILH